LNITYKYGLPFVSLEVGQNYQTANFPFVLIDTGSASTILSADLLSPIGIVPEPKDVIHQIRGVGGTEVVFKRKIDRIFLGSLVINDFTVEVGAMDYGFDIQGIIGTDLLIKTKAIIDLSKRQIHFP
jgi:hypothetical protein